MMTRRDKSKGRNWLHTLYVASPGFLLSDSEEQALDFTEGSDMGKSLSTWIFTYPKIWLASSEKWL